MTKEWKEAEARGGSEPTPEAAPSCGPFSIELLPVESADGPRSASPEAADAATASDSPSSSGSPRSDGNAADAAPSPPPSPAVVMQARRRHGAGDWASVALVSGVLVPVFTVFAPLSVLMPVACAARHGMGSIAPYAALMAGTMVLPLYYSAFFKKVVWRPLMLELTQYVRPFKVIKHSALPADRNYLFCWHPHGRLFYGFAVFCGLFDVFFPEFEPDWPVGLRGTPDTKRKRGREFCGAINDAMFAIPLLRNMLALTGMTKCSRRVIDRAFGRGDNVGLIVGGIEEVLEGTFSDKDVLYLRQRKGFAKIARDHGAGLVPVYAFGENQLFCHEGPAVLGFWRLVNRLVKVGAPLPIRGQWGLPIPFRNELIIVIGDPVFAQEGETLDAFHARYVAAVQTLFEQHVRSTSQPAHKLVIV